MILSGALSAALAADDIVRASSSFGRVGEGQRPARRMHDSRETFLPLGSLPLLVALALPLGAAAQPLRLGREFQVNTFTDALSSLTARWRPTPTATSSSSGRATTTATTPESSDDASRAPALRKRRSSRSTPTSRVSSSGPPWRPTSTATSSSSGRAETRTVPRMACSPGASQSSGAPRRRGLPGQLLHHGLPDRTLGGDRRRRRLRGRLGQPATRTARATGVFARRFSSDGASQAVEFQVNVYTFEDQQHPRRFPRVTAISCSPGTAAARTATASASSPGASRVRVHRRRTSSRSMPTL